MNPYLKIKDRFTNKLKRYQNIVLKALSDDLNESDTVTIITDILCDLFGFDKYSNLTSEYAIRKTFCDLAIKIKDKPSLLIECKAIGITLKDDHVRQATNYAAEEGLNWVVLTNAKTWKVYKIVYGQPVDKQLVYEFDLPDLKLKQEETFELLTPLCIESFPNGEPIGLNNLYEQKQVVNKYIIGLLLQDEDTITGIRRKLKRLFPNAKTDNERIAQIIKKDILKNDIIDAEQVKEYSKLIKKAERKLQNKINKEKELVEKSSDS